MWARLNRNDFDRSKDIKSGYDLRARGWGVCEDYEIEEIPLSEQIQTTPKGWKYVGPARIVNKYDLSRSDKWRYYDPINDTPDLFLKFARLNEGDLLPETILDWVRRYGLLGLNNESNSMLGYFEAEYAQAIDEQTKLAAAVLQGYEAVRNGDNDRAKQLIFGEFPHFFALDWIRLGGMVRGELESKLLPIGKKETQKAIEQDYDGDYVRYLLEKCAQAVETMVRANCLPALSVEGKPARAAAGWSIRNLIGAMYLQMYRLMAAGEDVTTCRYCGRLISRMPPETGERKKRHDKRYCNDACRQRYHYHNRVKQSPQKQQSS